MTNLKQQPDKLWCVRAQWTDIKGNQQQKYKSGFKKAKEAKDWAIDCEKQNRNSRVSAHKLTVKDFLKQFIEIKKPLLSPNTINGYEVNIGKVNKVIGHILVQQLRLDNVQETINAQTGVKPATIIYMYRTLHAALEYACKIGIISSNPAKYADLPKRDVYTPTTLTSTEVRTQIIELRKCSDLLYYPTIISVMLGCRRGEALGLRWNDIDFTNETVTITNNYTRNGATGTTHRTVKGKKTRTTSMPKFLMIELETLQNRLAEENRIEEYVCAINGELPDLNTFNKKFNTFQKVNGFTQCRFHDLRYPHLHKIHTFMNSH
jgi:integrase